MGIDRKLMVGSTDMLVLKLLESEDMYGYQIIEQLRARSNRVFDMKAGTLYPLLHQLARKGLLTSYDRPAGEARVRKYYHLTEQGRGHLAQRAREWQTFSGAVRSVMGGAECALD